MTEKFVSEFVERKCWTKAFKNPIISFTRDLLVSITARSGGKSHFYHNRINIYFKKERGRVCFFMENYPW